VGSEMCIRDSMTLSGGGIDQQDGDLQGNALTWSVDGTIVGLGNYVNLAATRLSPGNHCITLSATNSAGQSSSADVSVQVSPPVVATGGLTVTGTEGVMSNSQPVATFTDPRGADPAGNYAATIDWGDQSTSAGTITLDSSTGVYTVSGAHAYAEEGQFTLTVAISHASSASVLVRGTAAVRDPAVGLTPKAVSGVEGLDAGMVMVASFTDPGGPESVADYVASIDWGDGDTSAGVISFDSGSGTFSVTGHNLYKEEGTYTTVVTVTHDSAPASGGQQTATIADASLTATAGPPISAVVGSPIPMRTVATFTDANPNSTVGDFAAMIDWGDGTQSVGAVSAGRGGGFAVTGSHTYARVGPNSVTVSISDDGGSHASATLVAAVNGIVIALDPTAEDALSLSGKANLTTPYSVVVNSNSRRALQASGQASLTAGSVSVAGGVRISGRATVTPAPVTGGTPAPDPYNSLVAPSVTGQVPLGNALQITGSTTLQPGLYTGGIQVGGTAAVVLAPGTYVIQGGDLQVGDHATVTGQNVWLVFEALPGTLTCGGVQLTGVASLNLSAPTSGTGLGIAIYIDRFCQDQGGGNGSSGHGNGIEVSGQATVTAVGAIAVPTREVSVDGRARLQASAIDADTIVADGRAALSVS